MRISPALALLAALALPCALHAQGTLSSQGFGYPTGHLSASATGAAGSTAELDANSPLNPAAIALSSRYAILLHFEPEFRRTSFDGNSARSNVMRFPTFAVTGRLKKFTFAASVSTFLDRTWTNSYADSLFIDGAWVQSNLATTSDGAIGDSRLAVAYTASTKLQFGLGLHTYTGENRLTFLRTFPDTSGFSAIGQASVLGYTGSGVSMGAVFTPRTGLSFGVSTRLGGEIVAEQKAADVGSASIPMRTGVSASWQAAPGIAVSARMEQTRWSDLDGLGTTAVTLFDASEIGLGAEVLGPRLGSTNAVLRIGLRDRTLPFGAGGDKVSERSLAFGAGLPVARGRAQIDLALQRAAREAGPLSERAWLVSIGIGIRPY
jgi:hypothetical protein